MKNGEGQFNLNFEPPEAERPETPEEAAVRAFQERRAAVQADQAARREAAGTPEKRIMNPGAAGLLLSTEYPGKEFYFTRRENQGGRTSFRFREKEPEVDSFHPEQEYVVHPDGKITVRTFVPDEVRYRRPGEE